MRILNYQPADYVPVVHFGFLGETLEKWVREGHLTREELQGVGDASPAENALARKLGFDFNWHCLFSPIMGLWPSFEAKVVREFPDGTKWILNGDGVVILHKPGAGSIQPDVDHLLKDRAAWEEHYVHRLQFRPERVLHAGVRVGDGRLRFDQGGLEHLRTGERTTPLGLNCGSLYGWIRNWLTMEGACYLMADDPELFDEIINTNAEVCYQCVKQTLESGAKFDFAHFWEDICFKNGPLISPGMFREKVGPHYKRITDLVRRHGIEIVSLDCDGMIDSLVPIWLENGVNTMFPIEVGTWGASIAPWRERYGKELRGVGGMDKRVFSRDTAAVDAEIERLRRLVDLGGFLPCPDHRIAGDAKWENVRYYCDRMREVFGSPPA